MQFWHLLFLLSQYAYLNSVFLSEYIKSFFVAIRLDGVVAGYLVIPIFFTIYIPYIGWESPLYQKIISYYFGAVVFFYSFLSIVDIEFFNEFGTHLNLLAWQPGAYSSELWKLIWVEYPLIWIMIGIILLSFIWIKISNAIINNIKLDQSGNINKSISFILVFILIGLACRGGWQERPIDWGHAMFSHNNLANQTALNPIFNLGRSVLQLSSEEKLASILQYSDQYFAMDKTRELILSPDEKYIDSVSFNRQIQNPEPIKPNIILIVLESFVANFCGFINPEMSNVTPNLDQIANNGVISSNCFAMGKRSAYGLGSILCSWPVLPGYPIISQLESQKSTQTIASLLKEIGFTTYFIYGGDADFDNMKGFAIANGFDQVIEQENFSLGTPGTMWGVYDEYIFDKAATILDTSTAAKFLTIFTTTNHQPWKIPEYAQNKLPEFSNQKYHRGNTLCTMAYTDMVIGEFIQENRTKLWFDNTIFVFISDHSLNVYDGMYEDPRNGHIPFIIYAPKLITEHRRVDEPTSQADVVPTLLHLIGYPLPFDLMGRNILAPNYRGIACRIINDYFMWFTKDYIYTEVPGQNQNLYILNDLYQYPYSVINKNDIPYESIQSQFHAYIQSAFTYFKSKNNRNLSLNK